MYYQHYYKLDTLANLSQPFMGVDQGEFVLNGTTVHGQQPRHIAQYGATIHWCRQGKFVLHGTTVHWH